jgi:hypothetical protein
MFWIQKNHESEVSWQVRVDFDDWFLVSLVRLGVFSLIIRQTTPALQMISAPMKVAARAWAFPASHRSNGGGEGRDRFSCGSPNERSPVAGRRE